MGQIDMFKDDSHLIKHWAKKGSKEKIDKKNFPYYENKITPDVLPFC